VEWRIDGAAAAAAAAKQPSYTGQVASARCQVREQANARPHTSDRNSGVRQENATYPANLTPKPQAG
jgi:hypothetical protein